jgi:hypothetical protein
MGIHVERKKRTESMSTVDLRFTLGLTGVVTVGLASLYFAAPERQDLLLAAAVGSAFAAFVGIAGNEVVRRAAGDSMAKGLQAFLAVMTGKMLAFAAFLLIVAFSTSLNLPALAFGLVGTTVVSEVLIITGLRRSGAGVLPGADSQVQDNQVQQAERAKKVEQVEMAAKEAKESGAR